MYELNFGIIEASNYRDFIRVAIEKAGEVSGRRESESSLIRAGYHLKASDRNPLASFLFMMAIWDNYHSNYSGIDETDSLIMKIKKQFSNDYYCSVNKPLGDFKKINGSREETFYTFKSRVENTYDLTGENNINSFVIDTYREWMDYFNVDGVISDENILKTFYTLLFRTIKGILAEQLVVDRMNGDFNGNGKKRHFYAELANGDAEYDDIDIVIRNRKTGAVHFVSVKTGSAFEDGSIYKFRVVKGKSKPHYYATIVNGALVIKSASEMDEKFS